MKTWKGRQWSMRLLRVFVLCLLMVTVMGPLCRGEDGGLGVRLDVHEFELDNGMLFLMVERPVVGQVACRLAIRAGAALEETGKTGIAHLLEHMMFKGTQNFGTLDPEKDQALQERIEAAYQVVLAQTRSRHPDKDLIDSKLREMDRLRMEVQKIYVPQAFSSQLGRNGAVGVNAFTTKDQTQYTASVPADMIEQWFSIVSEQLFEPAWREFYVEKEVVQREWAFRYVNNPGGAAWLDLDAAAYTAHPYRNPTIGWRSDMELYNTTDAMVFHRKYYHPANAVCVLVGKLNVERVKALAELYFGRYPRGERAPERVTEEPVQKGPRSSVRFLPGARIPLVRIGFHGAAMGTEDFYALDAMTMVLGHGQGARLTQSVVNQGLAVQAWAYNPDNRYGGMVVLGGSPSEPDRGAEGAAREAQDRQAYLKACEALESVLLAEVEKLKTEPVSPRELDRIKKLNERQFLERLRSNEELADTLATLEVQVGWRYLTGYLERIARVTPEDVRRVARKYLKMENSTSVYVIPGGEPEREEEPYSEVRSLSGAAAAAVAAASVGRGPLVNHSAYPTPEGWEHPLSFQRSPQKIEYPAPETALVSGAPLFHIGDWELPLIDLVLLIKAGAVDVEPSKGGLSGLLSAAMVRGGTEKYPPSELAVLLDENAIRLSVSVGEEDTVVRLSVLEQDWDRGLAILEEVLARPRFDSTVLEATRQQQIAGLMRQGGDAHAVAMREAMIWHFKGHPYGRDPLEDLQTLPTISAVDLARFVTDYFVPSNMVVAVAGAIEKTRAVEGLNRLFRALPQGKAPERTLEDPSPTPPVLALIHKPGQVQSQVALCLPGVRRTDPEYWKINLLMDLFGGKDSVLYRRLRDDLGLVYAAWFHQTYKWRAGLLVGYIGCKGDRTRQALEESADIMAALGRQIPAEELEQKRLDALNSFVFNVDSAAALAEVYGRYRMRQEPLDTLEKIQEYYMEAGREELRLLAADFLKPGALQVFVVADKTITVQGEKGGQTTLERELQELAGKWGLLFTEIPLR